MSLKFPETHCFLRLLVCDWCGHKVTSGPDARAAMTGHLAEHPQSRYAQPAPTTGGDTMTTEADSIPTDSEGG